MPFNTPKALPSGSEIIMSISSVTIRNWPKSANTFVTTPDDRKNPTRRGGSASTLDLIRETRGATVLERSLLLFEPFLARGLNVPQVIYVRQTCGSLILFYFTAASLLICSHSG